MKTLSQTKLGAALGATLIAMTALWPAPAQASDKEWATAGKVLAGLAAVAVVGQAARHYDSDSRYERTVYVRPESRYCPPPVSYCPPPRRVFFVPSYRPVVEYRTVQYVTPAPVVREIIVQPAPPPPAEKVEIHNHYESAPPAAATPPTASDGDSVIVNIEEGRRLYQPKVRGAKAYLQVWSELEQKWLSVKEYPSIY